MSELSYLFPTHALMAGGAYANPGIIAHVDAESNLTHLWAGLTAQTYCRSVRFGFRTFEMGRLAGLLEPMVTSFHPAYQETIYGTEGVIVAQRVFVPFRAGYGEAVCWQLDLQAEGHRLLQIEVEIDWGGGETEPRVEQRYQDGLIVAQGGHSERATRVFGASGPPTYSELDSDGTAHLTYHILIEGYIDVPFILSFAPSGEQLAWNGFLALSDLGLVFQDSNKQSQKSTDTAEIVTPSPALNRCMGWAKTAIFKSIRRSRVGIAVHPATDSNVNVTGSAYVGQALAWIEPALSAEILEKLLQRAQTAAGGMAGMYHFYKGTQLAPADMQATTAIVTLSEHHLLSSSVQGDLNVRLRAAANWLDTLGAEASKPGPALDPGRLTDLERLWLAYESAMPSQIERAPGAFEVSQYQSLQEAGWQLPKVEGDEDKVLATASAILMAAYKGVAGLAPVDAETLLVRPNLPDGWPWLLLLNLPYADNPTNLILFGGELFSDRPIATPLPLTLCDEIKRMPSDHLVLAVRIGKTRRVFAVNTGESEWSGTTNLFEQVFAVGFGPGEGGWLAAQTVFKY